MKKKTEANIARTNIFHQIILNVDSNGHNTNTIN